MVDIVSWGVGSVIIGGFGGGIGGKCPWGRDIKEGINLDPVASQVHRPLEDLRADMNQEYFGAPAFDHHCF